MSLSKCSALTLLVCAAYRVSASAIPEDVLEERASYPFTRLTAFGDELSDNGNGSYAHGITGSPANVYGFGTWTDGATAISYLADLLYVPLTDYAFGGCCGGSSFGATIDNSYTPAAAKLKNGNPVPSVYDQIFKNYTRTGAPLGIKNSLQFIWTGENDLSKQTNAFYYGDAKNAAFASAMATRITADAERLLALGAPYVMVANIYPKHLAPVTKKYLCSNGGCVATWGKVITQANTAIKTSLANSKYANRIIYYDVYSFMINVMNNKNSYGLTQPLTAYCDGDDQAMWSTCISGDYVWQGATHFYWMNFIQPTTTVHKLIAQDMKRVVDGFFGF
ncbi:hypothetical protein B0A50_03775 [Salinomyces thailandicus]|uniref:Carbohydrate esterase family 16 protein n=1 Tax=Salinomyces thailandicus TaxID=706561 RepID=A0A4U0U531_9PEZI|nr:hypothetical protein B0A50_03775 [Salinomyces thailandica]